MISAHPSTTGWAWQPPDCAWPLPAPTSQRSARWLRPRGCLAREANSPRDVYAGAPAAQPQAGSPPGCEIVILPPLQVCGPRDQAYTRYPPPPFSYGSFWLLAADHGLGLRLQG